MDAINIVDVNAINEGLTVRLAYVTENRVV